MKLVGPSPEGRRWPQSAAKGSDEGPVSVKLTCPSSAASRHLLPSGEGVISLVHLGAQFSFRPYGPEHTQLGSSTQVSSQ